MQKPVLFLKSHVDAFTRGDGVTVAAHETKVQAAAPSFASHAAARRGIAESAGDRTGGSTQHDDDLGLSSTLTSTASHDDAKHHAAGYQQHLEAHGFTKQSEETKQDGAGTRHSMHFTHPSGAIANVAHSDRMTRKKGKSIPGVSMAVHSGVKGDEKAPWPGGAARRAGGPGEGEVGDDEHQKYGHYFKPGDKAKDAEGNTHTVVEHIGPSVRTEGGKGIHPTKLTPVAGAPQKSPAAKVAAMRKDLADRKSAAAAPAGEKKARHTGDDIGAGSWTKDHQVKLNAPGHPLHGKPGTVTGGDKATPGRVHVDFGSGTSASVHGADLRPADGHAWPTEAPPAAAKKNAGPLDPHPNVIGKAENDKGHTFDFGGKRYHATGKDGHSMHDSTPVVEHESEDGHRVWKDGQGRVHADSAEEAKKARGGK